MTQRFALNGILILLFSVFFLAYAGGCSKDDLLSDTGEEVKSVPDDEGDDITNSTFSNVVTIRLGNTVEIDNPVEAEGVSISASGGHVTIRSTAKEIAYVISGTTTDGSVKIYSDYKLQLTLDGVDITNPTGAAINIQSGKRVFVVVNEGTTNKLTDGSTYQTTSGEDMKATFFSEGQLLFYGNGTLIVHSHNKHAICSDDYIRMYEGDIQVTGTVSDGLHANDAVVIDGGTLTIKAGTDGIECEKGYILINGGNITIDSGDDGIIASYNDGNNSINPYMGINGGTFHITTTGTSANAIKARGNLTITDADIRIKTSRTKSEGIESKKTLTIHSGYIIVEAYDDCLNASDAIVINGGSIYCYSSNNDGVDSNRTLTVTGGTVIAIGTSSPEDGFDCDNNTFSITGGTLVGIGGSTGTPTSNACTQYSLIYGGSGTQNTLFHIESAAGEDVLTFMIPRTLSAMTVLFSSPALTGNTTYTIYSGGTVTGGNDFYGLYSGASYNGGSQLATFTTSSLVTTAGNFSGGIGGGGGVSPGRPGGR
ncbi:MAG: carbohydrate-binding domain-containing protein [Tannerellaceae bacterium]|nr:carbohydrate-binding domain-containing protein [Tannerellaceae bacterium]